MLFNQHLSFRCCSETEKKTTLDQALRGLLGDQVVRTFIFPFCSFGKLQTAVETEKAKISDFVSRLRWRRVVTITCLSSTWVLMPLLRVCYSTCWFMSSYSIFMLVLGWMASTATRDYDMWWCCSVFSWVCRSLLSYDTFPSFGRCSRLSSSWPVRQNILFCWRECFHLEIGTWTVASWFR